MAHKTAQTDFERQRGVGGSGVAPAAPDRSSGSSRCKTATVVEPLAAGLEHAAVLGSTVFAVEVPYNAAARRPPRVRYALSTDKGLERETGLEPATCSLEGCRSTN